jgi:riboflavin synthase
MFTGIIQSIGRIERLEPRGGDVRLSIDAGKLDLARAALGDSIAVNGVCLTAVELTGRGFAADVSRETLSLTTLGTLTPGSPVNLEPALTLATPLGGHLVSGHVDGVGQIIEQREDARSWRLRIQAPAELARYIAPKGSICVDGTSLTVNQVDGAVFELNIVPHTLAETIIGGYRSGTRVNLEVDLIARYLERLLLGDAAAESGPATPGLTMGFLAQHGFAIPIASVGSSEIHGLIVLESERWFRAFLGSDFVKLTVFARTTFESWVIQASTVPKRSSKSSVRGGWS